MAAMTLTDAHGTALLEDNLADSIREDVEAFILRFPASANPAW